MSSWFVLPPNFNPDPAVIKVSCQDDHKNAVKFCTDCPSPYVFASVRQLTNTFSLVGRAHICESSPKEGFVERGSGYVGLPISG